MRQLFSCVLLILTINGMAKSMDFTPNPAFTENEKLLEKAFANAVNNVLSSLPKPDIVLVNIGINDETTHQFPSFIAQAIIDNPTKKLVIILINPKIIINNDGTPKYFSDWLEKQDDIIKKKFANPQKTSTPVTIFEQTKRDIVVTKHDPNLIFVCIPCAMGRKPNRRRITPFGSEKIDICIPWNTKNQLFKDWIGDAEFAYKKELFPFDPIFVPLAHYLAEQLTRKKQVFVADSIAYYQEDHISDTWKSLDIANNEPLKKDLKTIEDARDKNVWCYISNPEKEAEHPTLVFAENKFTVTMPSLEPLTTDKDFSYQPNPLWSNDFYYRNNERTIAYFLANFFHKQNNTDVIMVGIGVAHEGDTEQDIKAAKPQQFPTVIANAAKNNQDKKFLLILIDGMFGENALPTGLKDCGDSEWLLDTSMQYPKYIQCYFNKNVTVLVIGQSMGRAPTRIREDSNDYCDSLLLTDPVFVPLIHIIATVVRNKKLVLFGDASGAGALDEWKKLIITKNDMLKNDIEIIKNTPNNLLWEYWAYDESGKNFPKAIIWNSIQNRFVVNQMPSSLENSLQLLKAKLLALAKSLKG